LEQAASQWVCLYVVLGQDNRPLRKWRSLHYCVAKSAFAEIRGGKEITLQGDGFATEEVIVPDYWQSNTDSIGSARVYCHNGGQLFRGDSWLSAERVPA
jgi:hypothetical protein